MAGYFSRIIVRAPGTRSYFPEDDETSLAMGWTHGCLSCARRKPVTVDRLEQHIEELEQELREARELLVGLAGEGR